MLVREITVAQRGLDSLSGVKHTMENCVELIQVLDGKGHFLMGGELVPLRRGVVLLIDSHCLHCSAPEEGEEYVRSKVILDRDGFLQLCELGGTNLKQGQCYLLSEGDTNEVDRLMELLAESNGQNWTHVSLLARIMAICQSAQESREAAYGDEDPILSYINTHLDQPLSLDVLAAQTHFSKYYLCEMFRRKTGMTPMRYIRLLRVSRAQRLLLTTDDSISNIGLSCGYDNFSFFCRVFHNVSGMSPSEYRKRKGLGVKMKNMMDLEKGRTESSVLKNSKKSKKF